LPEAYRDPGKMLGGPPRRDPTDQRVFNDEQSDSMEKLQRLETEKTKKMEQTEAGLKAELKKEKNRVEEYEQEERKLQHDIQSLKQDAKALRQEGVAKEDEIMEESHEEDENVKVPHGDEEASREKESTDHQDEHDREFFAQSRIVAPPYFKPSRPEDEVPVAVATTQEQWRRQLIAKDQVQVAEDQMQLAKDSHTLAQGQDKLTNLRTPGVVKEELLAEQVRDQKRIALDQELLVQSQKRLAEDMDSAIDGKLRWERLEDYRKKRIEKFQDMINKKLDRLYKAEIDFVKRGRKGKLRGAPLEVPDYGPVGLRIVSGSQAKLATGGDDGSDVFQESRVPEEAAEEEAMDDRDEKFQDQPVVHSAFPEPWCWFTGFFFERKARPEYSFSQPRAKLGRSPYGRFWHW